MRLKELLRLVCINMVQNKFKVILTSVGIVVGAATIVMVIAIGQGSKAEVAEQFKNLNAGAIDISYETANASSNSKGSGMMGQMPSMGGGQMPPGGNVPSRQSGSSSGKGDRNGNQPGGSMIIGGMGNGNMNDRMNKEKIVLDEENMEDLTTFVPGIAEATISFSKKTSVEGGELEAATTYTIGGVKSNYASISNLTMQIGDFIRESEEENKSRVCILGATIAKEIFGSAIDAYDSTIYIDSRPYVVNGVLAEVGSVSSGISPDTAIFIPYSTGIKYLAGMDVSPTITVIAQEVSAVSQMKENIQTVLEETYSNAEFTITDAGSKMEAASSSNETLTILLIAMAVIVFIVGGMLGVGMSTAIAPIVAQFQVRVDISAMGVLLAIGFAVITGTIFGFYPAWKASRLVPIDALNHD